ncbi:hypothetical protein [Actinomadura sp. NEAU-AAG7]|uniref:hypothetical protein n=1 Tax=Actinomadura sp. NEAU-AAG7 TaxID=2839640 RepID=UPI001BE45AB9|nr:hypothetical protein [Actinomadura sp. NEAU-AAG7]MBT2213475.1 hypothetical protein [Actinomadura sp. NEAU-AAG7]
MTTITAGQYAYGALDQAPTDPTRAALCAALVVVLVAVAALLIELNPERNTP